MKGALKVATASASIAIAAAAPASADTALYVGGTGWPGTPTQSQMTWLQNGVYAGREDTLVGVGYPASPILMNESIAMGARELGGAVTSTKGRKSLVGVSQGSLVVHEEERRIMALPENQRPAKDDVRFVYIGDPARPSGGIANWVPEGVRIPGIGISRPAPLVETPYETVYVTREYDGIADFPDRPLNVVSTANAVMGVVYLHPNYGVDLTAVPKDDITETTNSKGGRTTSYLVPTKELPLTKPLRQLGVDRRIVDEVDKRLRPLVDSGYKRNDTRRNTVSEPDEPSGSQRAGARPDDAVDDHDAADGSTDGSAVVRSAGGS
ncbi:PE-PPE domain-containing protein [Mycobacterium sp. IS-1742]|uniref:PE-PPE domain-containing protein n=1 Tax=Mycobacterium sp. IS-1742 TaxID=1772285 RepID=UPI0009EB7FB0|nr:PE-PPE domain-containing protein [Mycobacterium sp. IS-1742]